MRKGVDVRMILDQPNQGTALMNSTLPFMIQEQENVMISFGNRFNASNLE